MGEIIITTTNAINGVEIDKYLGLVTSNLVIGTNIFSDFVASFSDFFGGMSGTYRNQLDVLYQRAIADLTSKAKKLRANAILGVKIDFDEISGQGKSMFMVSITGTAVQFVNSNIKASIQNIASSNQQSVSKEYLQEQLFVHKWKNRDINQPVTDNEWEFILNHQLVQLAPSLYKHYLMIRTSSSKPSTQSVNNFLKFMSMLTYSDAVRIVYEDFDTHHSVAIKFIQQYNLFSPTEVLKMLDSNLTNALDILPFDKDEYTTDDVRVMREIILKLDNLPEFGVIENVKVGALSSKTEEKYICQCGWKNPANVIYCNGCKKNRKGITPAQEKIIDAFKEKVRVLELVLNN